MRTKRVSFDRVQGLVGMDGEARENSGSRAGQARRALRAAIEGELTPRQRECVELYFFQGLTMEQAARRLGIGKGTVCRHLQKARRRLGRVLGYAGMGPP